MAGNAFDARAKGLPEVSAILEAINPEENPEWVELAMKRGAKIMTREIRSNLVGPRPRRLDVRTGELFRSIRIVQSRLPYFIRVGTKLRWAGMYEYGPMRIRRPFIAPAVETGTPLVADAFHRVLDGVMLRA